MKFFQNGENMSLQGHNASYMFLIDYCQGNCVNQQGRHRIHIKSEKDNNLSMSPCTKPCAAGYSVPQYGELCKKPFLIAPSFESTSSRPCQFPKWWTESPADRFPYDTGTKVMAVQHTALEHSD